MKSLLVLLALTLTASAFARENDRGNDGRMGNNDGGTIVRIQVGNDRGSDSREMNMRMAQLERAVRELQNRVYDLEDDSRPQTRDVTIYTCAITTPFSKTFVASARTSVEATANAISKCEAAREAFCDGINTTKKCETSVQSERI